MDSVVSMGAGKVLGVLKSIQDQFGKAPGDALTVTVEPDTTARTVPVPDDLAAALDSAALRAAWDPTDRAHLHRDQTRRNLTKSVQVRRLGSRPIP